MVGVTWEESAQGNKLGSQRYGRILLMGGGCDKASASLHVSLVVALIGLNEVASMVEIRGPFYFCSYGEMHKIVP